VNVVWNIQSSTLSHIYEIFKPKILPAIKISG